MYVLQALIPLIMPWVIVPVLTVGLPLPFVLPVLLLLPISNSPEVGAAGQPIGGLAAAFRAGAAPIEPRYLYFAAGRPIGGPVGQVFRGVRATPFPFFASILGPGAPLAPSVTGIAGVPVGLVPGVGGAPIGYWFPIACGG